MYLQDKSPVVTRVLAGGKKPHQARVVGFALVCTVPFILAWGSTTKALLGLMLKDDTFSQIPIIPFVSLFLIWVDRKKSLSTQSTYGWTLGTILMTLGVIVVGIARLNSYQLGVTNQCSLLVFGVVLFWLGAFALFFGPKPFRTLLFPLVFLFFMVPIPEPLLSKIVYALQTGSADAAEWFFRIGGIPYLRRGLIFVLPGVSIRVAEECSGIRSSLALLITTVLAAHLFLRTTWKKWVLCLVVVPLAILKNGLRIMALSALSIYVDPGFLYGNLHRRGGIVFFMIALVLMAFLLAALQRSEISKPVTTSSL